MKNVDFLILGGGIAGTTAAEEIRAKDPNSSITIVTEEPNRLYSRVQLPHYLRDEHPLESVFVRTPESYTQKNLSLVTSTRVASVDTSNKSVSVESGETYSYKKLLIATGGKVNKLATLGADLPAVVYLRTLDDAQKIRRLIDESKEGLVVGGGFIGIDLTQTFIKHGLKTTAIIREKSFWEDVVGENSGKLLSQILQEHGVNITTEAEVTEFIGQGKLGKVRLNNGTELNADIAGVGVGIHMELEHIKDSGLKINKGVVTNEYLEASVADVWAAGDIAEFYDPALDKRHLLGNWANASSQGRTVGLNMVGEKAVFETNSLYSINIFEGNFSFLGDPTVDQNTEVIERGSIADNKLARLLIRHDLIVGASLINMPIDRNYINRLIKSRTKVTVSKEKLSDLSFDLSTIQ